MKRLLCFIFVLLFSCQVFALINETGVDPLRLEIGARPLGMGGAFVGLADDVNAVLYNPGGVAWAKGNSLTVKDLDNLTVAHAYPTGYGSSLGLGLVISKLSDIPLAAGPATSSGNTVLVSYGTKLNFIPALYNREPFQRIGVGLNVKGLFGEALRQTGQTDRSAMGWDMDLGVLWKATDWWSAGFSAQNFLPEGMLGGGIYRWDNGTNEAIPYTLKLGAAAKIIGDINSPVFMEGRDLEVAGEVDVTEGGSLLLRLGGEWGINKTYFFRAGLMQQPKAGSVMTGLNLGFGYRAEEWGLDLVSYQEPLRDKRDFYVSVIYFPKDWIVVKKLDVERPAVFLEDALEKISLEDNIITYDDRLEVFGKVKAGVEVYVDGLRAAIADDNSFKVTVPLNYEKNLVVVEARFEGEKKDWKYKVLRQAKIQVAEEEIVKTQLAKAQTAAEKQALKKKEAEIVQKKQKVEELVTLGVIEVTPESEFRLDASITRGELATWLAKAAGLPLPKIKKDVFLDVKQDHPLAPYIKLVVDWGLLQPFPDGYFRPDQPVTKEEGDRLFRLLKAQK